MHKIPDTTISFIGQKGIPKDFPGTSGIEAYVEDRMLSLVREGKTVRSYGRRWVSRNPATTYKGIELITLHTINTKFLDTLTYSLLASIHASFSDATLVWYQGIGPAFFAFIPKLTGKKIYATVHSLDWKRKKWNALGQIFLRLSESIAVRLSDKLFVVSSELQQYYSTYHNVATIVDKQMIVPQKSVPFNIMKKKYRLRRYGYLLYMGRFVPEKRIEWLIQATSDVHIPLVLAGGSSHSDSYAEYLRTVARGKNIFFVDYVFGKEKAELISNCKVFVLPSSLEGFPIAVVEALSYRRPCVVGNFLKPEYTGKVHKISYFQSDNYQSFVAAIMRAAGANRQKEFSVLYKT